MATRNIPPLPPWRDFRARYQDEREEDYRLSKNEFDIDQTRSRDHHLNNNDGALLGLYDLLRTELMGDGTTLRRGILNELSDRQKEMAKRQEQTREIVRSEIRDAEMLGKAREWTATKKWVWGTAGASIAAVLGTAAYFIGEHIR